MFQTEVDFGSTPLTQKLFTVTDTNASAVQWTYPIRIMAQVSYETPTAKTVDEVQCDTLIANAGLLSDGSIYFLVTSLTGPVTGKYKINYIVGYQP